MVPPATEFRTPPFVENGAACYLLAGTLCGGDADAATAGSGQLVGVPSVRLRFPGGWIRDGRWPILLIAPMLVGCISVRPALSPPATLASVTLPPLVLPTTPPRRTGPSPTRVLEVPGNLDTTGRRDVSEQLQSFIDGAPDDSVIRFPAGATFRMDQGIQVNGRSDLVFDGRGSRFLVTGCDVENAPFSVGLRSPSSGIVIRDFVFIGDNPSPATSDAYTSACEHAHGIAVLGATGVEIDTVTIRGVRGDCLYLGLGPGVRWADDVWFHDSVCEDNGRQGIAVVAGSRGVFERLTFDRLAMHVFDIEPNNGLGGATDMYFADNRVGTFGFSDQYEGFFFAANGSLDALVDDIRVVRNVVVGGSIKTLVGDEFTGFDGQRNRRRIMVAQNMGDRPDEGPVLIFQHVDGLVMRGNSQEATSGPLAVCRDCTDVVTDVPIGD